MQIGFYVLFYNHLQFKQNIKCDKFKNNNVIHIHKLLKKIILRN